MKVRNVAYAVPKNRYSSQEIAEWIHFRASFIENKIGIKNRYFLSDDETATGLASQACLNLFEKSGLDKKNVELLVFVTLGPDYQYPHAGALVHEALELGPQTASFDISLGCSGYVYALSAVKGFMQAQQLDNAVLITCEPFSKGITKHEKGTISVFGDAATATWMSRDQGAEIGIGDFGTDGTQKEAIMKRAAGALHPVYRLWSGEEATQYSREDYTLKMDGRAIFNFMMERVPTSISNCLKRNNLTLDDIDYFAMHQASQVLLDSLAEEVGLPQDKMLSSLKEFGNTSSSTIPLMLDPIATMGKGKKILVSGFGVWVCLGGLTFCICNARISSRRHPRHPQ